MIACGSLHSEVALVLEQPNKYEMGAGRPLSGQNTKLFVQTFNQYGFQDAYTTFAIKTANEPLDHYIARNKKTKQVDLSDDGKQYRAILERELSQLRHLKYIFVAGDAPLYFLTGLYGIHNWRGSIIRNSIAGREVIIIPILTPWFLQLCQEWNVPFTHDLKKMQEIMAGVYSPTNRDVVINPSMEEVMLHLNDCERRGIAGEEIAYDIEVNNYHAHEREQGLIPEVSMISFSNVDLRTMCIPFRCRAGDYFTAEQELDVWIRIAELLSNNRIKKIGQFVQFDGHFLLHTYGIRCQNIHCTAVAQHTISPELPKGLDFITSIWTDHQYYKNEGKALFAGDINDRGYRYNAIDSAICSEAFPKQRDVLQRMGNLATYDRQRKLIEPLTYMMEHGVKINVDMMITMEADFRKQVIEKEKELADMCGVTINPRSAKSLHDYFYGRLHIKPYTKRNSKGIFKPSYDETAMKRLTRLGYKEAALIQEIKRLGKMCANYLDVNKVDKDGRYRCFYDPTGTDFSRLSSKENIFGTGSNLQNWPKSMRIVLEIDEGCIGYSIDLSQAENRIVAYEGRILPMIEAFETGKDVHTLTTILLLNVMFGADKAMLTDPRAYSPLGDGSHTWRDWGKKANHGFNYDWGYKAFALKNELPETQGKLVYDGYHKAYPEVQKRYHASVKDSIRKTRTITNLKGRRTLFIGEMNDTLFKSAYSCIPQGTVGDIINEHGLEYIWYDSDFDQVELLTQTHDEIIFQIPLNETCTLADHARLIGMIVNSLECVLRTSWGREFVIPCDLTMLKNLYPSTGGTAIKADLKNQGELLKQLEIGKAKLWPSREELLIS